MCCESYSIRFAEFLRIICKFCLIKQCPSLSGSGCIIFRKYWDFAVNGIANGIHFSRRLKNYASFVMLELSEIFASVL